MREKIPKGKWAMFAGKIFVICPGCAQRLPLDHTVYKDGKVDPSLDCPVCDYHKFVQLEDWNEGQVWGE